MIGTLAVRCVATSKANGVLSTWCHRTTGVNALFLYACSIVRAFSVKVALHSSTLYERITFQSRQATTNGTMLVTVAFGIQGARILQSARVQAFAVEALLVVGTFAVCAASQLEATELGVTGISRLAAAYRVVILHVAVGVLSTVTWICADFIDARFT